MKKPSFDDATPSRAAVLARGYDHLRLGAELALSREDCDVFSRHWHDLVADEHLLPSHPGRLRRYGRFAHRHGAPTLTQLTHRPFFQSREVNRYAGGVLRRFAPLTTAFVESPLLQAILQAGVRAFVAEGDRRHWELGVHQIRTLGRADQAGAPTPEGPHRDGFDFVAMHLVHRDNVDGGCTRIDSGEAEVSILLEEPLETIFVDDRRCTHGATDIRPRDPARLAVRDTLIVTYHAVEQDFWSSADAGSS